MSFDEKIDFFTKKLLEWNKIHNLTGAKTKEEVLKNIEDSIYPVKFLPKNIKNAMDIGTGAGFPGLILAFYLEDTNFLLVEPRKKRAAFLNYIISSLNLKNIKVEDKRVEEISPQKFDLITSRAVAKTDTLLKLSKPFIDKNTILLFYKGEEAEEEVKDIKNFNYDIINNGKRKYLIIKGLK